jgi:hypothetical protein
MRFMMIVKATKDSEAGVMPNQEPETLAKEAQLRDQVESLKKS